jgi:hypothetical protein
VYVIEQLYDAHCDISGDGSPDYLDLDSDNDGIPDSVEASPMTDGLPEDTDSDGIRDNRLCPALAFLILYFSLLLLVIIPSSSSLLHLAFLSILFYKSL